MTKDCRKFHPRLVKHDLSRPIQPLGLTATTDMTTSGTRRTTTLSECNRMSQRHGKPEKKKDNTLVLQIPCKKVFRYPKPTPKLLAEGIGA